MAEKEKKRKKGIPVFPIIVAIVVIAVICFIMFKVLDNGKQEVGEDGTPGNQYALRADSADDIKIKDSDSTEVKIEKIQGKLELLNKEIDEKQGEMDSKSSELNNLYEEYVSVMNESQTGVTAEEGTENIE